MKMYKRGTLAVFTAAACLALLILPGCMTVSYAGDSDALEIVELINSGNSNSLAALSSDTFLLDGEILQSRMLIDGLWSGLTDSGFSMENPVVDEKRPVVSSDYSLFGNSPETEIFFRKYVPAQAMLFRIGTSEGSYLMIVGPAEVGENSIIAFGGPY